MISLIAEAAIVYTAGESNKNITGISRYLATNWSCEHKMTAAFNNIICTELKSHFSSEKTASAFETAKQRRRRVSSTVHYCNEPAVGFSTSSVTSTMYNDLYKIKCAGSVESLTNVQLVLITCTATITHNATHFKHLVTRSS